MSARLGDVLYLIGCVLSLSWFTLGVLVAETNISAWDIREHWGSAFS